MTDWKAVLEEIRGLKKIEEQPATQEEQPPEEPEQPDTSPKWWHFTDVLTRQDELLQAILEQLQRMEQVTPPVTPPEYPEYPEFPPGIEPKLDVIAAEQTRTSELLGGFRFITGQATVQTAGNAIEVVSTVKTYYLIVRAHAGNAGDVYIGGKGVSATSGYILGAGEAIAISIDNLKKSVWVDSANNGDSVSWIALVD